MAELVRASQLERRYGTGDMSTLALGGVSFTIDTAEYVSIIGRSGSGKSTLLNVLGLLDRPTGGALELLGERVDRLGDQARAAMRNRHIGFVFQFHHLLPEFSVLENVLMPARIAGGPIDRHVAGRALELLELLGIQDLAGRPADELSGGQKQRVAIGRALVNSPALVLADEPTGNLDSENAAAANALFRRIHQETGTTFVVVTHDAGVAETADRVLEVKDGALARDTSR